jgi:hypothetical protein
MENFAELMQRLLEIQSGGRQRSPELIAEDKRLMDALQKRNPQEKPRQPMPKMIVDVIRRLHRLAPSVRLFAGQ